MESLPWESSLRAQRAVIATDAGREGWAGYGRGGGERPPAGVAAPCVRARLGASGEARAAAGTGSAAQGAEGAAACAGSLITRRGLSIYARAAAVARNNAHTRGQLSGRGSSLSRLSQCRNLNKKSHAPTASTRCSVLSAESVGALSLIKHSHSDDMNDAMTPAK
ncbi:unnamed protein product, partial [Iphiclides podalirius]